MTSPQRIYLMSTLWPRAADFNGWSRTDRDMRLYVLSLALGRPITSANEIASNADFSNVKLYLQQLAGEVHLDDDPGADALRHKAREHIACLAVYVKDPDAYVRVILRNMFNRCGCDPDYFERAPITDLIDSLLNTPEFLPDETGQLRQHPSQLLRLVMTLNARLNRKFTGFRAKLHHSLHDMYILAGLQCSCKQCASQVPADLCPF